MIVLQVVRAMGTTGHQTARSSLPGFVLLLGPWLGPVIVMNLVCGMFCSYLAERKGYAVGGWFVLGALFGILALIAAAGLPSRTLEETEIEDPYHLRPRDEES